MDATAIDSMFPKLELAPIAHIFEDVGEGSPAFFDAVGDYLQIGGEQDHVGGSLRHAGRAVDRKADIRDLQRRRVVDAVAQEADDRAFGLKRLDDP